MPGFPSRSDRPISRRDGSTVSRRSCHNSHLHSHFHSQHPLALIIVDPRFWEGLLQWGSVCPCMPQKIFSEKQFCQKAELSALWEGQRCAWEIYHDKKLGTCKSRKGKIRGVDDHLRQFVDRQDGLHTWRAHPWISLMITYKVNFWCLIKSGGLEWISRVWIF